ncbi:alpha/beta fold hydrolase [Modestobacter sp. VKM Ac-2986]|uniref:alpha/beta fold hydrolase n=1 Tax=Modestobacter sp. VKM Ac-2986 TaxID=3004140 RepID=UPI0022A9F9EC|nr:alpha/beta fold hydrolase [Modestobacter sp. VKM Ac-2986]MCZ2828534.1 alpha/beta fold hydrolase [Modestobacter sp. VKM Ac-2986]
MRAAVVLGLLVVTGCSGGPEPVPGEETATVAGQRVWCAGEGPAVVLVHGIGEDASSAQWLDVERALAGDARVCRYDRPGTGASDAPGTGGRGADALDAELDTVVEHAAGAGPVVLVAHSFGGYPARVHAGRHPDRVAGLVLVDALDPSVGVVRGTGAADLRSVEMGEEALDLADVEAAAAAVTELSADLPLAVLSRGQGLSAEWTAAQDRLAALVEGTQVTVVDAGHQVPTEAPDAVVDAVRSVLPGG